MASNFIGRPSGDVETDIANTINKVFPDSDAYGKLLESFTRINEKIPQLGEGGYCKLSGSIKDGSFSGYSRLSTFDVDLTWIVNFEPLSHPILTNVPDRGNYVNFEYKPYDESYKQFNNFLAEVVINQQQYKLISPEKFKRQYPANVENVLKHIMLKQNGKPLYRILERLLVAFGQTPNIFDTTWYNTMRQVVTLDVTPVLQCTGGGFLEQFVQRDRPGNWPTDELLHDIKEHKYYLVPKNFQKEQNSVSWRMSFAPTEEALFKSMTPFARRCYCLLKLIARNIDILYIRADFLSTYHLKNFFFWALEENEEKFVDTEAIGIPMYHLLLRIRQCVEAKWLPFYFDKNVNLFGSIAKGDQEAVVENIETFLQYPKLRPKVPFPFLDSAMIATETSSPLLDKYPAHTANAFIDSLVSFMVHLSDAGDIETDMNDISNAFIKMIHDHLSECNSSGNFWSLAEEDFKKILVGIAGEPMVVKQVPKSMVEAFRDALTVAFSAITKSDCDMLLKAKYHSGMLGKSIGFIDKTADKCAGIVTECQEYVKNTDEAAEGIVAECKSRIKAADEVAEEIVVRCKERVDAEDPEIIEQVVGIWNDFWNDTDSD